MEISIYDFTRMIKVGNASIVGEGIQLEVDSYEIPSGIVNSIVKLVGTEVKKTPIDVEKIKTEEDLKKIVQSFLPDGFTVYKNW